MDQVAGHSHHHEHHHHQQIGWLRASVLGANDGLLSTAALLTGMVAGHGSQQVLVLAGVAALVAGAFSMATGEYVSVSSQADTQAADLAIEERELRKNPELELLELTRIYIHRGVDETVARQVATQLMEHDALGAHARDELGLTEAAEARPIQAAIASAASFVAGAILPILVVLLVPMSALLPVLIVLTLVLLSSLGALAAWAGGAAKFQGALRVLFWGALSLAATSLIGSLLGAGGI
ncbi:VIT1/CCC1 transporter family protein [Acidithiobacillus sp. MC6.1]|nr:VIT1/CCC1 transporter family protein [Acidithiobacillus sp. MC6.1]